MNGTGDCAEIRPELGVYVLGAIAAADRAKVVRHLTLCEQCREEVAGLARLPALLRTLPAETAMLAAENGRRDPAPPEMLQARLIRRVAGHRRRRRWLTATSVAVLAAAAGVGWAVQLTQPESGRSASRAMLETRNIGGVIVLTNAAGFTLYWFGPDTATSTSCTGSCARRWPPVMGPAAAGPGVTGALGTITRPGGALQATFDGHPLYTASVDTAPGQDRGNNLDASGGVWHQVVVSGGISPPGTPSPSVPAHPSAPARPSGSPAVSGYDGY